MAAETGIELFATLKKELEGSRDPHDAERAAIIQAMLDGRGADLVYRLSNQVVVAAAPDLYTRGVFPQISLFEEHRRQGLIKARKYAGALGMGQDEYIATLPQFPERPSVYEDKLGLTVPVIVENRRPWVELAELSAISVTDYLKVREAAGVVKDWEKDGFQMNKHPVISIWVQDGTKFVKRIPQDVRKELLQISEYRKHYRAGRIPMGIALWEARPDMLIRMFWDLVGTSVGSGYCAYLSRWGGRTELGAGGLGLAYPRFRGFVFGSEIGTLSLAA